jgi:predicted heme/steroid binding protein
MSREIGGRESAGIDHLDDPNSTDRTGGRIVRAGEGETLAAEGGARITHQIDLIRREMRDTPAPVISMGDLSPEERTQALDVARMSAPNRGNETQKLMRFGGEDLSIGRLIREIANSNPEMLESFATFSDFVFDITQRTVSVKGVSYQFCYKEGLLTTNPNCGFRAAIAYDKESGMVYVHVFGTIFNFTKTGRETMWADAGIATGTKHPIYDVGVELAQTMKDTLGERCILSGHSLGGSVVQCACAYTGIRAIALNPAPIRTSFVMDIPPEDLRERRNRCLQISVDGDAVSEGAISHTGIQFSARKVRVPFYAPTTTLGFSEHVAGSVLFSIMVACADFL